MMGIRRWIGRARRAWFHLFQARRHRRVALERVDDLDLISLPETMNPALFVAGRVLARMIAARARPGMRVLDMGTGTGIVGLRAARAGAIVVAVDLNPEAARCARINTQLNSLEDRMTIREGDLYAPVAGERFDIIAFNPPFYRGAPRDKWDMAWRSEDLAERFPAGLAAHLAPKGSAYVVLSTSGDSDSFRSGLQASGLMITIAHRAELGYEQLTIYRATREAQP